MSIYDTVDAPKTGEGEILPTARACNKLSELNDFWSGTVESAEAMKFGDRTVAKLVMVADAEFAGVVPAYDEAGNRKVGLDGKKAVEPCVIRPGDRFELLGSRAMIGDFLYTNAIEKPGTWFKGVVTGSKQGNVGTYFVYSFEGPTMGAPASGSTTAEPPQPAAAPASAPAAPAGLSEAATDLLANPQLWTDNRAGKAAGTVPAYMPDFVKTDGSAAVQTADDLGGVPVPAGLAAA